MNKNITDYVSEFRLSMLEAGLVCDDIVADGQIHRCDTSGKNGKGDGAYVLHLEGSVVVGGFENHQAGTGWCTWKPERGAIIDPGEKRKIEQALAAMRAKRDADSELRRKRAAELASSMWSEARPAEQDHPYLARKRVKAHDGIRVGDWKARKGQKVANTLLVPITDGMNILSLQAIFPEKQADIGRDKDFIPGGKKEGCYFPIGDDITDTVVLCEGYATGATIHEATSLPVLVAFDARNLVPVAINIRATHPHAEIVVAADNDRFTKKPNGEPWNPGLECAQQVLTSVGNARIVAPQFDDSDTSSSDWNDYMALHGSDAVRQHFLATPSEKTLFPFVDVSELVADIKPVSWLVRDYFERDSLALVYGAPGGGKSFFSVDVACSIATGSSWMGHKVHAGPVFYIAGEGHNGLARRFRAWEVAREVPLKSGQIYKSGEAMHVLDEASVANVSAQIGDLCARIGQPPALVVIDTLARNFGPGDENSTEDMSKFVSHVDTYLRKRFECCVLLVHHSGHNAERARGSSALKAAVDAEYEISKDDGGNVRIRTTKMKDAEIPPDLMLRLKGVELPGLVDEDGAPVTSAILDYAEDLINSKVGESDDGTPITAKEVLAVLDRGWLSVRDLCATFKCKKNQGEKIVAALKRYEFLDGKTVTQVGKDALSRTGYMLTQQDKPIWKRGE